MTDEKNRDDVNLDSIFEGDIVETEKEIQHVAKRIEEMGLKPHISKGIERTVIGAIGDEQLLKQDQIKAIPAVENVVPIMKPYKLVSREFKKENTIIKIGDIEIGGNTIVVIAGPCAVESREQIIETAKAVKSAGAKLLRGGAFKPRTSPYSFQGMGEEGLKYLKDVKKQTGLKIVTEVMDTRDVWMVEKYSDILPEHAIEFAHYFDLIDLESLNRIL